MKPGYSKILINDMVVPLKGANVMTTTIDLNMASMFAAIERTEAHWWKLIGSVEGLIIKKIWNVDVGVDSQSVIEVEMLDR